LSHLRRALTGFNLFSYLNRFTVLPRGGWIYVLDLTFEWFIDGPTRLLQLG